MCPESSAHDVSIVPEKLFVQSLVANLELFILIHSVERELPLPGYDSHPLPFMISAREVIMSPDLPQVRLA